ncbi:hypothetical protein ES705_14158 [subsurface metagenome]
MTLPDPPRYTYDTIRDKAALIRAKFQEIPDSIPVDIEKIIELKYQITIEPHYRLLVETGAEAFLLSSLITGLLVARYNWKIEINIDRRSKRKELIKDIRFLLNESDFDIIVRFRRSDLFHRIAPHFSSKLKEMIYDYVEESKSTRELLSMAKPGFVSIDPKLTQEKHDATLKYIQQTEAEARYKLGSVANKTITLRDAILNEIARIEKNGSSFD